ncbi:uncharacterized protein [Ptychodera flava]|uniref:uncharacterized protein n=1 Tax=Ptychodera flava TaxID=63121 RepID=UPI00396A5C15
MVRRNVKFGIETNRTLRRVVPQPSQAACFYVEKRLNVPWGYRQRETSWLVQMVTDGDEIDGGNLLPNIKKPWARHGLGADLQYSLNKRGRWCLPDLVKSYIDWRQAVMEYHYQDDGYLEDDIKVTLVEHSTSSLLTATNADCIGIYETHTDQPIKLPTNRVYSFGEDLRKKPNPPEQSWKKPNKSKAKRKNDDGGSDIVNFRDTDGLPEVIYDVYYGRSKTSYPMYKSWQDPEKVLKSHSKSRGKSKGQKEKNYHYRNGYRRNELQARQWSGNFNTNFEDEYLWDEYDADEREDIEDEDLACYLLPSRQLQTEAENDEDDEDNAKKAKAEVLDVMATTPSTGMATSGPVMTCQQCGQKKHLFARRTYSGAVVLALRCDDFLSLIAHDEPYTLEGAVLDYLKSGWLFYLSKDRTANLKQLVENAAIKENRHHLTITSLVGNVQNSDEPMRELLKILNGHLGITEAERLDSKGFSREEITAESPRAPSVNSSHQLPSAVGCNGGTIIKRTVQYQPLKPISPAPSLTDQNDEGLCVVGVSAPIVSKVPRKTRFNSANKAVSKSPTYYEASMVSTLSFRVPTPPSVPPSPRQYVRNTIRRTGRHVRMPARTSTIEGTESLPTETESIEELASQDTNLTVIGIPTVLSPRSSHKGGSSLPTLSVSAALGIYYQTPSRTSIKDFKYQNNLPEKLPKLVNNQEIIPKFKPKPPNARELVKRNTKFSRSHLS